MPCPGPEGRSQEASQENDAEPVEVHAHRSRPGADSGQRASNIELWPESAECDHAKPADQADQMCGVAHTPVVKSADPEAYEKPQKEHDGAMAGQAKVD